jgi:hypothetical protein
MDATPSSVFRSPEIVARTCREATLRETGEIERLRTEMAKLEHPTAVGEMTDPDLAHRLEAVSVHRNRCVKLTLSLSTATVL